MATLTQTIADEKWPEFIEAFARAVPVEDGFSLDAWPEEWARRQVFRKYSLGRRQLHEDRGGVTIDQDIIT